MQSQEYLLSQDEEYFYDNFQTLEEMEIEEEVPVEKRNLESLISKCHGERETSCSFQCNASQIKH